MEIRVRRVGSGDRSPTCRQLLPLLNRAALKKVDELGACMPMQRKRSEGFARIRAWVPALPSPRTNRALDLEIILPSLLLSLATTNRTVPEVALRFTPDARRREPAFQRPRGSSAALEISGNGVHYADARPRGTSPGACVAWGAYDWRAAPDLLRRLDDGRVYSRQARRRGQAGRRASAAANGMDRAVGRVHRLLQQPLVRLHGNHPGGRGRTGLRSSLAMHA